MFSLFLFYILIARCEEFSVPYFHCHDEFSYSHKPKAMGPPHHGLKLPRLWVKINFTLHGWLARVFCYSNGKLTNMEGFKNKYFVRELHPRNSMEKWLREEKNCLQSAYHQKHWQYWQLEHKCATQTWESMLNMHLRVILTGGWGS